MVKNMLLIAVLATMTGCTTISNIGKLNRVMPQVQRLVVLKNQKDVSPSEQDPTTEICGQDASELLELQAYANQLGWLVNSQPVQPNCMGLIYPGKK